MLIGLISATWHHDHHWWIPLVWLTFVVVVVLALRSPVRSRRHHHSAMSILAERYAKGAITPDEYRERLDTLKRIGSR